MNRFLLLLFFGIVFQLPSNFSAVSASSSSSFDSSPSSLSSSSSSTPATSSSSSVPPPQVAQHDDSFEPLHLVDGALNPARLSSDESSAGKCEVPYSYRDFYIDISQEDKLHKNLVLRVTLDQFVDSDGAKTELLPDALKVLMWESSIPKDRKSRLFSDWSDDGTYSVALNARNLDADRYYVSIQCSSHLSTNSLPRAYSVHVSLSPSDLTPGAPPETGEICDHELVYHNVLVPSALLSSSLPDDGSVVPPDLAFTVCTPSDSSALISVSARMLEPPLRLAMPYKTVGPGDSCRTFTMCANELEEGVAWIGIFGRSSCTYYTVSAEFVTGEDECELEMGDQTESHRSVRPIKAGYSEMAYCEPNTWTDFVLEITNSNARANLVFEAVVNSDGAFNPSAISVHLFPNEISGDRVTEFRTESSSSNIYSVFKTYLSYLNLQNQQSGSLVYVGVRCGSDAQSFTLLAEEIPAKLTAGHVTRGEVCPGSWIYHYIDVPNDALPATRLDVGVALFEGEIAFSVHLDEPPIRLLPPWAQADVSLGSDGKNVFVCNVEPGHRYYIGVVATSTCSVYDIVPTMTVEDECEIVRQEAFYHSMEAEEMRPNIPVMDSCGPNEYTRYKFNVKPEDEQSNLLFLVELRREQHDTADDPKALEIFLYRGEIPEDYSTEYLADAGLVGQWSIAVNSNDVLIGDYFLAVKCSPYKSVRFSVVVVAMPSHLVLNHRTHGEICKSEFAYFSFDLAEAIERASSRRVQAMLADTSTAKHLVVEVYRYSESFYAMTGHNLPPFKLIPPYTTVDHDNPTAELKFCDIKEGETNFVALLGAHGCSSFDVLAHIFEGPCEKQKPQAESEEINVVGASEIFVEHFVRGSCEAKSVKDYYISIDDGLANDNYIFEVENLGPVGSDQGALKVCLFDGSIPLDRHSEICASSSSDGIVSVAISYLDIHAGNWFVSAQCTGDSAVSYRLVAHKITSELSVGKSTHGEVCYGEWVIHHLTLEPAVFAEYESQVVVNVDERRSINSAGATGVHLRVEFVKYVGDFYSMTQAVYPPFKLSATRSYEKRPPQIKGYAGGVQTTLHRRRYGAALSAPKD